MHQMGAMRPPRIPYLVVLSIHEVKDGKTRPNVTRTAVTFSQISGRCAVRPVCVRRRGSGSGLRVSAGVFAYVVAGYWLA